MKVVSVLSATSVAAVRATRVITNTRSIERHKVRYRKTTFSDARIDLLHTTKSVLLYLYFYAVYEEAGVNSDVCRLFA